MNEKDNIPDLETPDGMVEAVEKLAASAREMHDNSQSYVHVLSHPLTTDGETFDELTFDWTTLTGEDSLSIEAELRLRGITLVMPAFTGDYLAGMASRACTARLQNGRRLSTAAIRSLPLCDFQKICDHARNFMLAAGA